jgi:hypothetical protein
MAHQVVIIRKMSEFIDRLEKFTDGNSGPWYRGVNTYTYDLEPSAYRSTKFRTHSRKIEQRSLQAARSKMMHFSNTKELKLDIDWLCYLQHNGTPTRFLDWTYELDVAIYFAFEDYIKNRANAGTLPCVWVYKPTAFLQAMEIYINKGKWPPSLTALNRNTLLGDLLADKRPLDSNFIDILDKQTKLLLDNVYVPFVSSFVCERAQTQGSCFIRFPILNRQSKRFDEHKLNKFILNDRCFDDSLSQFIFLNPTDMYKNLDIWNLRTSNIYPEVQNIALEIKENLF